MTKWIVIFVFLSILLLSVLIGHQSNSLVIEAPVLQDIYKPGSHWKGGTCDYRLSQVNVICDVNSDIIVSYDGPIIIETTYFIWNQNISVGSLVVTLGNPLGTSRKTAGIVMYIWRDMYAAMIAEPGLTPFSHVAYLVYGGDVVPERNWKGFRGQD